MASSLIVGLILCLYVKTYRHKNVIDDICSRGDYGRVETWEREALEAGKWEISPRQVYDKVRGWGVTAVCIGVHVINSLLVRDIWGNAAGALYAVSPLNVCGAAWKVGNFYHSGVMCVLIAWWGKVHGAWWLEVFGYWAGLKSVISPLMYPLVGSWWVGIIGVLHVMGKDFRGALKRRNKGVLREKVFQWKRVVNAVNVYGWYVVTSVVPRRLGFFPDYREEGMTGRVDRVFWLNLLLLAVFCSWGVMVDRGMLWWWLVFLIPFSHVFSFGMFVAERYLLVSNVAFCVLAGKWALMADPGGRVLAIVGALWFYRSWTYIRAYRSNKALMQNDVEVFPRSAEAYNNLGSYFMERGQDLLAAQAFLSALGVLGARPYRIVWNLAICYERVGQYEKALWNVREALRGCQEDERRMLEKLEDKYLMKVNNIEANRKKLRKMGVL